VLQLLDLSALSCQEIGDQIQGIATANQREKLERETELIWICLEVIKHWIESEQQKVLREVFLMGMGQFSVD